MKQIIALVTGIVLSYSIASAYNPLDRLDLLIEENDKAYEIQWFFAPGRELRRDFGTPVAGAYDYHTRSIVINMNLMPAMIETTFYHELCHDMWYYGLTEEQQDEYSEYWYWEREAPTEYSKKNVTENFAEMCRIAKYDKWMDVTRTAIPRIKESKQYLFFQDL